MALTAFEEECLAKLQEKYLVLIVQPKSLSMSGKSYENQEMADVKKAIDALERKKNGRRGIRVRGITPVYV